MMYEGINFYILVPVYKVEKYIRDCIKSVLNQTYQNFNLVLVDDGSPDNCGKICDDYAAEDGRIKVIHQPNRGLLSARQAAISYVRNILPEVDNSYIVFLDSDDTLKPIALEKIDETIKQHQCDMVIYGYDRVCKGKNVVAYDKNKNHEGLVEEKRELYSIVFSNSGYNSLCRKAIHSKLIRKETDYASYYHIAHAEDLLQSIQYYKDAQSVLFLNESLYNYTINPGSITQSEDIDIFKVDFTVRQKVMEFLIDENVFSSDDWAKYIGYSTSIFLDAVKKIIRSDADKKKKTALLKKMHEAHYYQTYLKEKKYGNYLSSSETFLINAFNKKNYGQLILFGKLIRLVDRVRN